MATKQRPAKRKKPKPQATAYHPEQVQREGAELRIIKAFLAMVPGIKMNKQKEYVSRMVSRQEIVDLFKDLQSAIVEQQIVKASRYKPHIEQLQRKLGRILENMGTSGTFTVTRTLFNTLQKLTPLEDIRPSVPLLKKYTSLHGQLLNKVRDTIRSLLEEFVDGIRVRKIRYSDPYYNDIRKSIIPSLRFYLDGEGKHAKLFAIKNPALHGLREDDDAV